METTEQLKQCRECEKILPISHFGNSARGKGGKSPRCKSCVNQTQATFRRNHPLAIKTPEQQRRHKQTYKENHPDRYKAQKKKENAAWRAKYRVYINHSNREKDHTAKNKQEREARAERKFLAALIVANELNKK